MVSFLKFIFRISFLLILLIFIFQKDDSAKDEKAVALLRKSIEVLGGVKNIEISNNHSYIARIKRVVISSFDPPKYVEFTEYFSPPDKVRRDFNVRIPLKLGNTVIRSFHIFNGNEGWSNDNARGKIFKYDKDDKEIARLSSKWVNIDLANWCLSLLKSSYKFRLIDVETKGKIYIKIEIEDKDSTKEESLYIDKESFLPAIKESFKKQQGKSWQTYFEEYKKVNSVFVPFKVKEIYRSKDEFEECEDIIVELNWGSDVKIEDEKFKPPKQ